MTPLEQAYALLFLVFGIGVAAVLYGLWLKKHDKH